MRYGYVMVAGWIALIGGAAGAAPLVFECQIEGGGALRFSLDAAQFAAPVNGAEPPRRQVAQVAWRGARWQAEAILTQDPVFAFGVAGFHAPARGIMATVARDGTARLSEDGRVLHGVCARS